MKRNSYRKKTVKVLAGLITVSSLGTAAINSVQTVFAIPVEQTSKATEVEVSTFEDLKSALEEDNGITSVKFSANIEATGGIAINKNKASLSIDLQGHTYTDVNSTSLSNTIHLATESATKTISIKNGAIQGKNYYGPVSVADSFAGVTLSYENITYTGPQMIYNQQGYVSFSGSSKINIKDVGSASPVQEFAQVGGVTISGEFDLMHEKNTLSTFSFNGGNIGVPYLVIDNDAKVTITNEDDCVFNNANDSLDLIIKPNADVTINSASELTDVNGFGDLTVQSNAALTVNRQTEAHATEATVDIDRLLEVNEGASFLVNHGANGTGDVLHFAKDSVVEFNSPKKIELTSKVGNLATNFPEAGTMKIQAEKISGWESSTIETPDFSVNEPVDAMLGMDGGKISHVIYSNIPDLQAKMTYNDPYKLLIETPEVIVPAPVLNVVNDKDKQLTGLGEAGATINAFINGQLLGTTTVGSDLRWTMPINPQVEGTVIDVIQVIDGNESPTVSQTVSHLATETVNFFKLGYWQPYGLVLEGSIDNAEFDLTNNENVTKTLNLVNDAGEVVKSFNCTNIDWYNSGVFNGYQGILENTELNTLEGGEYKLSINLKTTDGVDVTQDLNVGATTRTIGDYHPNFNEIESNDIGNGKQLSLINTNGVGYLIIQ
ncbi:pectate lyase-like adhesive domain-containing protein [Enterococcus sp. DIV0170]|uniref:pectate lyase-like adhesive domain-containing protein n=1 Tax=Enterococcus sp. DIV0170 TaxID=2774642 RepID=UPI003F208410